MSSAGAAVSSTGPAAGTERMARSRRELAGLLLGGAAGAGVVLLASRQGLARVIVRPPRPLPATVTELSAQDLRPAIAALAVAALASLAAVLATRGLLRRLTGLITVALGAGIALLAAGSVTAAAARAAAGRSGASPAGGSGAGTAAGSVTAGTGGGGTVGSLAGFGSHVELGGSAWRALMVAGAALIIAAGLVVLVRARRLPAMSGRYERPSGPVVATAGPAAGLGAGSGAGAAGATGPGGLDGSCSPAGHTGPAGRTGAGCSPPGASEHVGIAERGGRSDGMAGMSLAGSLRRPWRSSGRQGQVSGALSRCCSGEHRSPGARCEIRWCRSATAGRGAGTGGESALGTIGGARQPTRGGSGTA